eukprot:1143859-Pelagomonas_calceolata.AAC.4
MANVPASKARWEEQQQAKLLHHSRLLLSISRAHVKVLPNIAGQFKMPAHPMLSISNSAGKMHLHQCATNPTNMLSGVWATQHP